MDANFNLDTLDFLELTEAGFFDQLDEHSFEKQEVLCEISPGNLINKDIVEVNDHEADQPTERQSSNFGATKQPTFLAIEVSEKEKFVQDMKNANTIKKTDSAIRQFQRWLSSAPRHISTEISQIPVEQLDNYIGSFLLSIRKADGSEYEPDTLTSYHRGIDRYLREKNYKFSMVQDREFSTSRAVLSSKRKQLKMSGKGNRPYAAQPITSNEIEILKEKSCIGLDSPQQLLNKMWLNNTMMFGLRGGAENRSLCWGDVSLKTDVNGTEYLEFNERCTKTRTGATSHSDQRAFKPKQYAHENPESCPVHAYKQFSKRRTIGTCTPQSPFYLAINYNRRPESEIWYKNQPLGESSLRGLMKKMAEKADLPGRKTNHSARKTTCTKLLHSGVAPTTIQQLTGHKNVQSVNNYAVASDEMQRNMSDILSDNTSDSSHLQIQAATSSQTIQPFAPQSTYQASSLSRLTSNCEISGRQIFQNAHLENCQIVINNHSNSPKPKRRRIRMIDSDSD